MYHLLQITAKIGGAHNKKYARRQVFASFLHTLIITRDNRNDRTLDTKSNFSIRNGNRFTAVTEFHVDEVTYTDNSRNQKDGLHRRQSAY